MQEKRTKIKIADILLFAAIIGIASIANVVLKIGVNKFIPFTTPLQFISDNMLIGIGYILYLVPTLLTVLVYKKFKVSLVQTILALVYIFTPVLAFIFGLESINFFKITGIAIITFAVAYIVNTSTNEHNATD